METFSALLDFCAGNSPVNGHWRGALMFSLICVWINGWVNKRDAGDLRRYHVQCDVIVMKGCSGHFFVKGSLAINGFINPLLTISHHGKMADKFPQYLAALRVGMNEYLNRNHWHPLICYRIFNPFENSCLLVLNVLPCITLTSLNWHEK